MVSVRRAAPFLMILLLTAAVAGCASAQETPAAPNVSVNPETGMATSPAVTLTPAAATLPPLISTPTPFPTATSAQPVVSPTTPPSADTIPGLIGPENFPENVNPLTGETVSDPSLLARRPVAVKVSNYPPVVRPQAGLNSADLVFEHYAEGGVTRFTAVFYGQDARPVGSIRSGRLIDLEIPVMYDAAFAYSGSSGPVREMMAVSPFFSRIISPDFGHGGFYRVEDPDKAFEHTLFTDTPRLRSILQERDLNHGPNFSTNMAFLVEPPPDGTLANSVEIRYIGTNAFWRYDPVSVSYLRWTDGSAHTDANTGLQLSFKNVILVGAHHEDTEILEDLVGGGHYSIQIQIWGEGPTTVFRNGQRYEGRWRRENPGDMLTFFDLSGNVLPLSPGNSFVEVVPLGFTGLVVNE